MSSALPSNALGTMAAASSGSLSSLFKTPPCSQDTATSPSRRSVQGASPRKRPIAAAHSAHTDAIVKRPKPAEHANGELANPAAQEQLTLRGTSGGAKRLSGRFSTYAEGTNALQKALSAKNQRIREGAFDAALRHLTKMADHVAQIFRPGTESVAAAVANEDMRAYDRLLGNFISAQERYPNVFPPEVTERITAHAARRVDAWAGIVPDAHLIPRLLLAASRDIERGPMTSARIAVIARRIFGMISSRKHLSQQISLTLNQRYAQAIIRLAKEYNVGTTDLGHVGEHIIDALEHLPLEMTVRQDICANVAQGMGREKSTLAENLEMRPLILRFIAQQAATLEELSRDHSQTPSHNGNDL